MGSPAPGGGCGEEEEEEAPARLGYWEQLSEPARDSCPQEHKHNTSSASHPNTTPTETQHHPQVPLTANRPGKEAFTTDLGG